MNIYETFETDQKLETEKGIELNFGDFKFFVLRSSNSNKKYTKAVQEVTQPYSKQITNGTIDPEVAEKLMAEVFARSIVLGWEGVKDRKGKEIPFTKENCVKLLIDLPDFFQVLKEETQKASYFRSKEIEEEKKL